jgi:hypothetical protein
MKLTGQAVTPCHSVTLCKDSSLQLINAEFFTPICDMQTDENLCYGNGYVTGLGRIVFTRCSLFESSDTPSFFFRIISTRADSMLLQKIGLDRTGRTTWANLVHDRKEMRKHRKRYGLLGFHAMLSVQYNRTAEIYIPMKSPAKAWHPVWAHVYFIQGVLFDPE